MEPFWCNSTAVNQTTASSFSMADCLKAMELGKELRNRMLRSMGDLAELECQVCHRKATFTNAGFGDELHVCEHIYAAVVARCQVVEPSGFSPPLGGLRISVY